MWFNMLKLIVCFFFVIINCYFGGFDKWMCWICYMGKKCFIIRKLLFLFIDLFIIFLNDLLISEVILSMF